MDAIQAGKRAKTALPTSRATSWLTVPLLAAGFLVVIGVTASWRQGDDAIRLALAVANNQAKLQALSEIERDVRESESNARGYIITGNQAFADQQHQANQELQATFKRASQLLHDSPSQAASIETLNNAITSKQALIQSSIALRKQGNIAAAKEIVNWPSVEAMRRLQTILDHLQGQSNNQLEANKRKLDQASLWARSLEFVTGAGLVGLLISSGLMYQRQSKTIQAATRLIGESESLFRSLFEQASMGRALRSMQGECQANQAYISMLGYSQGELTSMDAKALIVPEDLDQWECAKADLLAKKLIAARLSLRYKHKFGSHLWIEESLQLLRNSDGEPIQWISTILDISKQKRLEAERRELALYTRSLIEANPDTMINIKQDGTIQDVNEAMVMATGMERKQLVGQDFSSYFSDPEKARMGYQKVFADGFVKDYGLQMRHRSGSLMDVLFNARIFRNETGVVAGIIAVARDISERKRLERELNNLNESLEKRVTERTAELKAANEELEAFSYSVSHDLRAPLRAVDGFSRKVMLGYGDKLDQEGLRLLGVVRQNAVRMGKLIDDLLAFSRLGRREMHFVAVSMQDLAESSATELIELEPGRQINFSCEAIAPCQGDPAMLKEVWMNLLSNAIKFTRHNNPAQIHVGSRIEGEFAIYWIQDNGAGFDMAYAEKLFGVFQRLHSQEEFEGSGVGLALSQRIIHRHHGRIWGESQIGQGATFSFTLPLQRLSPFLGDHP